MIQLVQPTFNIKKTFLDRPAVMKALNDAERQSMMKQLAYIRRRARSMLRRRKKTSEPEQPPSVHTQTGEHGIKTIFFGYQQTAAGGSGVVGPVRLNQVPFVRNSSTVPNALEQGGNYSILEEEVEIPEDKFSKNMLSPGIRVKHDSGNVKFWIRKDKRRRDRPGEARPKRWRRIQIRPRPFMMPALEAEIEAGTIMEPWHNSFHA